MSAFRDIGDIFHLISILWLLVKLIKTRSCGDISGKTQLLFAIVYTARLWSPFPGYVSPFYITLNIMYVICYYTIALLIFVLLRKSYRSTEDTFLTEILLVPTFVIALFADERMTSIEKLWSFSLVLDEIAILPQLYMIYKHKNTVVEKILLYYLIPLGLCRLFYIFDWVYLYTDPNHFDTITIAAGFVSIAVYIFAFLELFDVKVVREDNSKFLKKNILFISSNEPYKKIVNNEKTLSSEQLFDGNV
ncbi:ER lumen protein-retaining receptor 1-like [Anoplophora glabripennis]|uniref:ER lumen protein-retaining receptor 1-like n=1 Tax=Anoplophora glabripennis TaxID=217634 RepID=UPI00087502C7|nr:ER lumen protein-retaining receptor 1-like [Anoplophora glabripennis]